MRRRDFLSALAGTATVPILRPFAARAQPAGKVARVGFLGPALTSAPTVAFYRAFLARMEELGFRDGQNLQMEHRAIVDPRGLSVVAAELVRSRLDVLLVTGPEAPLQAVAGVSGALPIVMVAINFDPIARGYIASLARPGGNITGVVFQQLELAQKQIELLKEAFPGRTRTAVLYEAQSADQLGAAERAAKALGLQIQPLRLESPSYDFDGAFAAAVSEKAQTVLVLSGPAFSRHRTRIAQLAIERRLPTMFIAKHYVEAGGLMSYGVDYMPMWRRAADYAAKILNGTKPADLPVEQASRFETVVNLKTAKAIALELPTSILLRADEVIE